jgi:hypothetical protein
MMMAYIDMGTGSYLIQLLIAGLAGVSYACRRTIRRGFTWLKAKFGRGVPPSTSSDPDTHG